jgi:arylformamidase
MPNWTTHTVTRRTALRAICTAAVGAPLLAQRQIEPPPHEKGPKVFLDYDQVELGAAYNQAAYAHNLQQIREPVASNNALARARHGAPRRVGYGPTEIERLDIYRTRRAEAPVNIFVHGSAWRRDSAADSIYLAETFVNAGAHFVVPDFAAVQDVGGSLMAMEQQARSAIAWIYNNAATFDGNADRVYVSAYSSGVRSSESHPKAPRARFAVSQNALSRALSGLDRGEARFDCLRLT